MNMMAFLSVSPWRSFSSRRPWKTIRHVFGLSRHASTVPRCLFLWAMDDTGGTHDYYNDVMTWGDIGYLRAGRLFALSAGFVPRLLWRRQREDFTARNQVLWYRSVP